MHNVYLNCSFVYSARIVFYEFIVNKFILCEYDACVCLNAVFILYPFEHDSSFRGVL